MYDKEGPKYKYKKIPTKVRMLKRKFHKFANLDMSHIEHILRLMGKSDKNEFNYYLDENRIYNDCKIVHEIYFN